MTRVKECICSLRIEICTNDGIGIYFENYFGQPTQEGLIPSILGYKRRCMYRDAII